MTPGEHVSEISGVLRPDLSAASDLDAKRVSRDRKTNYRADIDGLRAIAVLVVIFYHLRLPGFTGGFVGVDVFFVISGFLITSQIQAQMDRGEFSLNGFYLRRVRRLAPALLIVSVCVAIVAMLVLYPEDMKSYAASVALQFVSLQNFVFFAQGEYFRGLETKPLLHTWSLAVEEQFYLVWPLLLLSAQRFRPKNRLLGLLGLMAGSLLISAAFMRLSPKAAFYLLPARAWELGLGAWLALSESAMRFQEGTSDRVRSVIAATGLSAILASVILFSSGTPFPGYAVLLPTIGTALFISGEASQVSRIVGSRWLVGIGLISYPMYLWHWPIIAFGRQLHRDLGKPGYAVAIILATLILSVLTYRFVETPIRLRAWLREPRRLVGVVAASAILISAFGIHAWATEGAAYRFPPAARLLLTAPFRSRGDRCGVLFGVIHPTAVACTLAGKPDQPRRLLLWGNSHADMWSSMLTQRAAKSGEVLYLNTRTCRALPDGAPCTTSLQQQMLAFIGLEHVTDVVLASTWYGSYDIPDTTFERELGEVVSKISEMKVRVWLVVDTPNSQQFDPVWLYQTRQGDAPLGGVPTTMSLARRARELSLFTTLKSSQPNGAVRIIDPTLNLCDDATCWAGRGDVPWYRDTNHLTDAGADVAASQFDPLFRN